MEEHKAIFISSEAQHCVAFGALHATPALFAESTPALLLVHWPMTEGIVADVVHRPRSDTSSYFSDRDDVVQ